MNLDDAIAEVSAFAQPVEMDLRVEVSVTKIGFDKRLVVTIQTPNGVNRYVLRGDVALGLRMALENGERELAKP